MRQADRQLRGVGPQFLPVNHSPGGHAISLVSIAVLGLLVALGLLVSREAFSARCQKRYAQ